jgi:hypothetical protein
VPSHALWLDLTEAFGIQLLETYHHKPLGYYTIEPPSIQTACRDDEGMINAVCEEEKELTAAQATTRTDWVDEQLLKRPRLRY